tara:strand:+ start:369 stop:1778 length:1410 start_codon:yes stop_codon:yes gene_type:complete
MTEIVNNNNGMAFDLLETGSSLSATSGHEQFNSFFSDIDNRENSELQDGETTDKKLSSLEETMSEILNILKNSELNIDNDTLTEIASRLRSFFDTFNKGGTQTTNTQGSGGNDNFLQLMRFLDKIKSILKLNANSDGSQSQEINRVLDQIIPKLNKEIKGHITRNAGLTNNNNKIAMLNKQDATDTQNSAERSNEVNVRRSSDFNITGTSITNSNAKALQNAQMTQATLTADKIKSKIKPNPLGKFFDGEKKSDAASNGLNKIIETKSELMPTQESSNGALGKDLANESKLAKQNVASNIKMDTNSSASEGNLLRAPISKNESSNRLLNDLNMLSKSWGEKLIEKIEKSIMDGIEKIEISLSPKSLGKLNITINMQDSVAKINIITESSSVTALLGEAEAKLSQMMEATGLKLASLQTLTQQFGQNKKGKEQSQKLALTKKKENISDPEKTDKKINNEEDHKEGLNLIA